MTDSPNEKKFMRETIVKPKESKSRRAGRMVCLVFLAVILGIVSAVSFVLSIPLAEKYLGKETTAPSTPITIEKDNEPGMMATMETMESTAPETQPEPEYSPETGEEEIRRIVRDELDQEGWTIEKVKAFNQVVTGIGKDADKSIVTVSAVKHQKDWFDNPVESTGQFSGVILAVNSGEIVILTGEQAIEDADSLKISFGDGSTAAAWVKQTDTAAGMATIAVNPAELAATTVEWIESIELGNSYSVQEGDLIIAVGSPAGRVYSLKHGSVTYVAKGVQTTDGQTRVIYTDIECNKEAGTYFLNLSGQLVGWATSLFDTEEMDGTRMMSISEYKGCLQKLSNGIPIPYLGIMGQEVSAAMQEEGVPNGIYITESILEGPAYLAGIQNGDILTKIQGDSVLTIRDFQNTMEDMESGAEIAITIQRKGIDEYREIEYHMTIGAR